MQLYLQCSISIFPDRHRDRTPFLGEMSVLALGLQRPSGCGIPPRCFWSGNGIHGFPLRSTPPIVLVRVRFGLLNRESHPELLAAKLGLVRHVFSSALLSAVLLLYSIIASVTVALLLCVEVPETGKRLFVGGYVVCYTCGFFPLSTRESFEYCFTAESGSCVCCWWSSCRLVSVWATSLASAC